MMKFKDRLQGFIIGLVISIFSIQAFAISTQKTIDVSYNNIKLYVDGNLIMPKDSDGNIVEPFIYNGTTYLPVRSVGEALGKSVDWDGDSQSVYIGGREETKIYLGDQIKSYSKSAWVKEFPKDGSVSMGRNIYTHGLKYELSMLDPQSVYYNLDAKYVSLSGLYGPTDDASYDRTSTINIYGDGELLGSYESKNGDLPKDFNVDVKGVLQLKIEFSGGSSFAIANAYLN